MQGHFQNNKEREVQKKRTQIRKKIRRQQIDKYFEERRKEILSQQFSSSQYVIKHQLQSPEGRTSFISNINRALLQTAPNKWKNIIEEIIVGVPYFHGDYDEWIQTSILDNLASTIKSEMSQLGYQHLIMKIFTSILNHIKDFPSKTIDHIIKTLIIQNTVVFMKIIQLPPEYQIQFFYFLSTFCRINYKVRNFILEIGAGELLQQFGKRMVQQNNFNQQMRYNFLGICSDYLKIFISKETRKYPDLSFVLAIMPIIFDFLQLGGSERIVSISLICLLLIVKGKRQIYYKKFLSQNILQHLFSLTKNPLFSKTSLNILSYLASSQTNQVIAQLVKLGIKDLLYQANCQMVDYRFVILTLTMLDHLTVSEQEVLDLIRHKIWRIACNALVFNNHHVRYQAYHFMNAIMTALDTQSLKLQIFKQNKLIDLIISQIQQFKKWPAEVIFQALKLLNSYINLESSRKHFQSFHIFESVYKLSQILQKIAAQSSNAQIIEKASIVYDIYIENYMDNCTI